LLRPPARCGAAAVSDQQNERAECGAGQAERGRLRGKRQIAGVGQQFLRSHVGDSECQRIVADVAAKRRHFGGCVADFLESRGDCRGEARGANTCLGRVDLSLGQLKLRDVCPDIVKDLIEAGHIGLETAGEGREITWRFCRVPRDIVRHRVEGGNRLVHVGDKHARGTADAGWGQHGHRRHEQSGRRRCRGRRGCGWGYWPWREQKARLFKACGSHDDIARDGQRIAGCNHSCAFHDNAGYAGEGERRGCRRRNQRGRHDQNHTGRDHGEARPYAAPTHGQGGARRAERGDEERHADPDS